jgi:hypothetical protein
METAVNLASLLSLGFFLGMRHATDADHVVAVATIVSARRSLRYSALIGAAWGIGHTITVMLVGAVIMGFGVIIPERLGLSMEFAVGIMLVVLGVLTLTGIGPRIGHATALAQARPADGDGPWGEAVSIHEHVHAHGAYLHAHPHSHGAASHGHAVGGALLAQFDGSWFGRSQIYQWARPFVVGLVHGLAGSAAVVLAVLSIIHDPLTAMGYLVLFGLGTVGGMIVITSILSVPFAYTANNMPRANWRLRVASGLISFTFGLYLVYDIGFAEGGLFTENPHWYPY